MTEQVDLDALIAVLRKGDGNGCRQPTEAMRTAAEYLDELLAELRQERERNAILTGPDSDERDALITDPLVRRIQEERERADSIQFALDLDRVHGKRHLQEALSLAEETIENALRAAPKLGELRWRKVDQMIGILRKYDDQKEGE